MSIQIDPDFDAFLHREVGGDTSWVGGYLHGAFAAFALMGMAEAIRNRRIVVLTGFAPAVATGCPSCGAGPDGPCYSCVRNA